MSDRAEKKVHVAFAHTSFTLTHTHSFTSASLSSVVRPFPVGINPAIRLSANVVNTQTRVLYTPFFAAVPPDLAQGLCCWLAVD